MAKAQFWTKARAGIEEFSNESMALSNLSRLRAALAKAKLQPIKEENKTRLVSGTLEAGFVTEGAASEEEMKVPGFRGSDAIISVEFVATLDKESGRITKLLYTLTKESVMSKFTGGRNNRREDVNVVYSMQFSATDAKVEIPKELAKFFSK